MARTDGSNIEDSLSKISVRPLYRIIMKFNSVMRTRCLKGYWTPQTALKTIIKRQNISIHYFYYVSHNWITRYSVGVSMSIMYGNNVKRDDSYCRAACDTAAMAFKLMLPTFTLLNFFPALSHIPAWFPMAVAQRMIQDTKRLTAMLVATPIDVVKNKLVCRI